jgi:hypothetical protein
LSDVVKASAQIIDILRFLDDLAFGTCELLPVTGAEAFKATAEILIVKGALYERIFGRVQRGLVAIKISIEAVFKVAIACDQGNLVLLALAQPAGAAIGKS